MFTILEQRKIHYCVCMARLTFFVNLMISEHFAVASVSAEDSFGSGMIAVLVSLWLLSNPIDFGCLRFRIS